MAVAMLQNGGNATKKEATFEAAATGQRGAEPGSKPHCSFIPHETPEAAEQRRKRHAEATGTREGFWR